MGKKRLSPTTRARTMDALVADGLGLYYHTLTLPVQEREAMQALTRNRDGVGLREWRELVSKCTCVQLAGKHTVPPTIPGWLDADSGKPSPHARLTNWQHYCRKVGEPQAIRERKAFLVGHTDALGHWWCGACLERARWMTLGARCDPPFPDLAPLTSDEHVQARTGQSQWEDVAAHAGSVLIAELVEAIRLQSGEQMHEESIPITTKHEPTALHPMNRSGRKAVS